MAVLDKPYKKQSIEKSTKPCKNQSKKKINRKQINKVCEIGIRNIKKI